MEALKDDVWLDKCQQSRLYYKLSVLFFNSFIYFCSHTNDCKVGDNSNTYNKIKLLCRTGLVRKTAVPSSSIDKLQSVLILELLVVWDGILVPSPARRRATDDTFLGKEEMQMQ